MHNLYHLCQAIGMGGRGAESAWRQLANGELWKGCRQVVDFPVPPADLEECYVYLDRSTAAPSEEVKRTAQRLLASAAVARLARHRYSLFDSGLLLRWTCRALALKDLDPILVFPTNFVTDTEASLLKRTL